MILVRLGWEAPAAHACRRTAFTTWSRVCCVLRTVWWLPTRTPLVTRPVYWRPDEGGVLKINVFKNVLFMYQIKYFSWNVPGTVLVGRLCHWEQFSWLYKRAVSDRSLRQPTLATWNCAVGPIQCREQDNQMNQNAKFGRQMFRMQNTPLCTNLIPIILRKSPVSERNTGPVTWQILPYQHCVATSTVYSPMAFFIRSMRVSISSRSLSVFIRPAVCFRLNYPLYSWHLCSATYCVDILTIPLPPSLPPLCGIYCNGTIFGNVQAFSLRFLKPPKFSQVQIYARFHAKACCCLADVDQNLIWSKYLVRISVTELGPFTACRDVPCEQKVGDAS